MKIRHIDHVGVVVDDLDAAKAFFLGLGLEVRWEGETEGISLERVVGLAGARTAFVYMRTPDGQSGIELVKFFAPPAEEGAQRLPANALGIRHIAFEVDDIEAVVAQLRKNGTEMFSAIQRFEGSYKLCYCRGPEGIILELAEPIK